MKGLFKFVALVMVILFVEVAVLSTAVWAIARSVDWASVDIRDHREGVRVHVPFPAAALNGSLALSGCAIEVGDGGHETREAARALAALADDLAEVPDMKLVEIEEDDAHVVIRKEGKKIRIEVRDRADDVDVTITVPESSMRHLARAIERNVI